MEGLVVKVEQAASLFGLFGGFRCFSTSVL